MEYLNNILNLIEDILVQVKFTFGHSHILVKKIQTLEKLVEELKNEE